MNDEINKILDTVTLMYQKYGIKSVTMDDVSREMGISKKTLYLCFSDKNDLVNKAIDRAVEKVSYEYEKVADLNLNAVEELLEYNRISAQVLKDHSASADYDLKKYYPEIFDKTVKIRVEKTYKMVLANLQKGKMQGLYRKNLNEDIIARLYVSRTMAMQGNSLFSHEELLSVEFFKEIFIYHIHGIANAKGMEVLERNLKKNEITV